MGEDTTMYHVVLKRKGRLRLYLNDPLIKKEIENSNIPPAPLIIEDGEICIAQSEKGTHIFFAHPSGQKEGFIPVFLDIKEKEKEGNLYDNPYM